MTLLYFHVNNNLNNYGAVLLFFKEIFIDNKLNFINTLDYILGLHSVLDTSHKVLFYFIYLPIFAKKKLVFGFLFGHNL